MAITSRQLKNLQKFRTASFAYWDSKNSCNAEAIKGNLKQLHGRIIILGLNPSGEVKFLENFHKKRFDRWYEEGFSKLPFKGSYMTDLISHHEPTASIVIKKWKKNEKFKRKNMTNLRKQFKVLEIQESTPILCIGQNTKELFSPTFPEFKHNTFSVNHPNSYRKKNNREVFLKDLKEIGRKIGTQLE